MTGELRIMGDFAGADQWIRRFQSEAGGAALVCFPHAGGSASYFFPWSRMLAPAAQVWAIQYPGRQDRRLEPCIDNIPELADAIHGALSTRMDGPCAFFGHSMGAVLAFEVARRLEGDGGAVTRLFASGRRAPSRHRDEDVHRRADAGVVAELRLVGGTDPRVLADPELLRMILPTVRGDYQAIETYSYSPGPPLNCGITAMVGDADPKTTVDEAAAWAGHCAGEFELRVFPGDHFYLDTCRPGVIDTIAASLKG